MKTVALEMHVTASTREHSQSKLLDLLFQYSNDTNTNTDIPIHSLSESGRASRMRILSILDAFDLASNPPPNIVLDMFDREKVNIGWRRRWLVIFGERLCPMDTTEVWSRSSSRPPCGWAALGLIYVGLLAWISQSV